MARLMILALFGLAIVLAGPAFANPVLNSAVLPNARTVSEANAFPTEATIFMTTLNSGDMDATNCTVVTTTDFRNPDISKVDVSWARLDSNGIPVGNQNDPFTITAGGGVNLVLGIGRNLTAKNTRTFFPVFHVECDGGFGSAGNPAVNSARIVFEDIQQDILPIIATPSLDGIATFDDGSRLAVFSVAAVNNTDIMIGTGPKLIDIRGEYLGFSVAGQFDFMACETDPATGVCITTMVTCSPNTAPFGQFQQDPPCLSSMIGTTAKTFSFFVILPPGVSVPFFPGLYRFAVTFTGPGGGTALTSVALRSSPPAAGGPVRPFGQYEMRIQNTADLDAQTIRSGNLTISGLGISGHITRILNDPQQFFYMIDQYFEGDGAFMAAPAADAPLSGPSKPADNSTGTGSISTFQKPFELGQSQAVADILIAAEINRDTGGTIITADTAFSQGTIFSGSVDLGKEAQMALMRQGESKNQNKALTLTEYNSKTVAAVRLGFVDFGTGSPVTSGSDMMKPNDGATFNAGTCNFTLMKPWPDMVDGVMEVRAVEIRVDSCTDPDLTPLQGVVRAMNIFVRYLPGGSPLYDLSFVGDPSTGTVDFQLTFSTDPAGKFDQPQTGVASGRQKMAQDVANKTGEPVYWRANGVDTLMATPQISTVAD